MVKILAITGYKAFELGIFKQDHKGVTYIKKAIKKRLVPLIEEGLEWVIISGQLGTELWAAEVVFELKEEFTQLQLAVLTPHLDQELKWNETNKELYELVVSKADFVDSITKRPYENPGQLKIMNKYIVEKTNGLLAFYDDEKKGSSFYMVQEARNKSERTDYPIFYITPYDIEDIVNEDQYNESSNWY